MANIKMKKTAPGSLDGVNILTFEQGCVYNIEGTAAASYFLQNDLAEVTNEDITGEQNERPEAGEANADGDKTITGGVVPGTNIPQSTIASDGTTHGPTYDAITSGEAHTGKPDASLSANTEIQAEGAPGTIVNEEGEAVPPATLQGATIPGASAGAVEGAVINDGGAGGESLSKSEGQNTIVKGTGTETVIGGNGLPAFGGGNGDTVSVGAGDAPEEGDTSEGGDETGEGADTSEGGDDTIASDDETGEGSTGDGQSEVKLNERDLLSQYSIPELIDLAKIAEGGAIEIPKHIKKGKKDDLVDFLVGKLKVEVRE